MSNKIIFNPDWSTKVINVKTPHQKYYSKDGTMLPGVTTVLGVINKPQLIRWAAKEERDGLMAFYRRPGDVTFPEKYFFEIKKDTAATVGTGAHFMAECLITERNPEFIGYDDELIEKSQLSFNKFRTFWKDNGFRLVQSEAQLVSEHHRYGGTLDQVAVDKSGNLILIDLKTSKAIYGDYFTQVAAYSQLWNENRDAKLNAHKIVRIGKEDEDDFEIKDIPPNLLQAHWDRFQAALAVYKTTKYIEQIEKYAA